MQSQNDNNQLQRLKLWRKKKINLASRGEEHYEMINQNIVF